MYEKDKMKYPGKEKKLQVKRIFETVVTITLFLFSLSVLFFTVSYLFNFTDFTARLPFSLIKIFKDDPAGHVMSYLSTDSKETVQKDVILLLEKKREELYRIEEELKKLVDEKKLFLYSMGQKKKVFQENISIIDGSEIRNNLKSIVQLNKSELRFHNEAERRINLYLNIHQKKREELLSNKEQITWELAELTGLMQNLKNEKGIEKFPGDKAFFTQESKKKLYERLLFLIDHSEYEKALEVFDTLLGMDFDESETVQENIVRSLLAILKEYKEKRDYLESASIFDDIKMSFLGENYDQTFSHLDTLNADVFMNPLLADLRNVLYSNTNSTKEISEEIELTKNIKKLRDKALEFENRGDYEKAIKIYEDLLILNLPSYDREYLISKIHSIMVPAVKNDIKREENTQAIKYLENARALYLAGKEKEACEFYMLLVTDCSSSDYVEEAITNLLKVSAK